MLFVGCIALGRFTESDLYYDLPHYEPIDADNTAG